MAGLPLARPDGAPARLSHAGETVDLAPGETVLDALLRHGVDAPHSCRKGSCFSCMMRAVAGPPPAGSQDGLRDTLRDQGYLLACRAIPESDLEIALPDDDAVFGRATVVEVAALAPAIRRVRLAPRSPFDYHAGQFVNLRRADGLVRSYSLASVARLDATLEIHVKRLPGGRMSEWICDTLAPGEMVEIQGPNGACYYLAGDPDRPLLLVGTGSGLAPLAGIAREALDQGHRGPIHLYHGSRHADGLYLRAELDALAAGHANFHYTPCLSGGETAADCRAGRADAAALADHPRLQGFHVYLCGHPAMVHATRKAAYLAGAALPDIHADPFETAPPLSLDLS